jgi:hypothetical protein
MVYVCLSVCLSKRRTISTLEKTGRYHERWYEYDATESQSNVKLVIGYNQ